MNRIGAILLTPFSWIYSGAGSLRNWGYDNGLFRSYESALPVICVGNAVLGGSGKSPIVQFISSKLQQLGVRPVILSRGYGGSLRGPHLVNVNDLASDVGDEPLMHCRFLNDSVPVVIARDRVLGAQFIARRALGDVIVLDDGFQHRRLKRDLNLLLIDSSTPQSVEEFNQGRVFPAGPFRERKCEALKRADALIFVRRETLERNQVAPALLANHISPAIDISLHSDSLVDLVTGERLALSALRGRQVVALSAIAKPDSFFSALRGLGMELKSTLSKRDHASFSREELVRYDSDTLIVTAKDAVKLRRIRTAPKMTFILTQRTSCDSTEGDVLLTNLLERVIGAQNIVDGRRHVAGKC